MSGVMTKQVSGNMIYGLCSWMSQDRGSATACIILDSHLPISETSIYTNAASLPRETTNALVRVTDQECF
jgi:hypothetical protein